MRVARKIRLRRRFYARRRARAISAASNFMRKILGTPNNESMWGISRLVVNSFSSGTLFHKIYRSPLAVWRNDTRLYLKQIVRMKVISLLYASLAIRAEEKTLRE